MPSSWADKSCRATSTAAPAAGEAHESVRDGGQTFAGEGRARSALESSQGGAEAGDAPRYAPVSYADIVGHRNAGQPKHAIVAQAAECNRITFAAGIADNAHFGPKLDLAKRQIVDMPEETPGGRAQAMQNSKRRAHWTLKPLGRTRGEL